MYVYLAYTRIVPSLRGIYAITTGSYFSLKNWETCQDQELYLAFVSAKNRWSHEPTSAKRSLFYVQGPISEHNQLCWWEYATFDWFVPSFLLTGWHFSQCHFYWLWISSVCGLLNARVPHMYFSEVVALLAKCSQQSLIPLLHCLSLLSPPSLPIFRFPLPPNIPLLNHLREKSLSRAMASSRPLYEFVGEIPPDLLCGICLVSMYGAADKS